MLLSLVVLAMVAALLYLRLDLGLAFIALSIPFFLYPKPLLGKAFSLVETLTLISFCSSASSLSPSLRTSG